MQIAQTLLDLIIALAIMDIWEMDSVVPVNVMIISLNLPKKAQLDVSWIPTPSIFPRIRVHAHNILVFESKPLALFFSVDKIFDTMRHFRHIYLPKI